MRVFTASGKGGYASAMQAVNKAETPTLSDRQKRLSVPIETNPERLIKTVEIRFVGR